MASILRKRYMDHEGLFLYNDMLTLGQEKKTMLSVIFPGTEYIIQFLDFHILSIHIYENLYTFLIAIYLW